MGGLVVALVGIAGLGTVGAFHGGEIVHALNLMTLQIDGFTLRHAAGGYEQSQFADMTLPTHAPEAAPARRTLDWTPKKQDRSLRPEQTLPASSPSVPRASGASHAPPTLPPERSTNSLVAGTSSAPGATARVRLDNGNTGSTSIHSLSATQSRSATAAPFLIANSFAPARVAAPVSQAWTVPSKPTTLQDARSYARAVAVSSDRRQSTSTIGTLGDVPPSLTAPTSQPLLALTRATSVNTVSLSAGNGMNGGNGTNGTNATAAGPGTAGRSGLAGVAGATVTLDITDANAFPSGATVNLTGGDGGNSGSGGTSGSSYIGEGSQLNNGNPGSGQPPPRDPIYVDYRGGAGGAGGSGGAGGAFTLDVSAIDAFTGVNAINVTGGNGGNVNTGGFVIGAVGGTSTLSLEFPTTGNTVSAGADLTLTVGAKGSVTDGGIVGGLGGGAIVTLNGNNLSVGGLDSAGTTNLSESIVQNGGSAGSTLTVGSDGNNHSFGGILQDGGSGTLTLTQAGAGTLTLSGANTYSGGTTIQQGAIAATGTALGTGTVAVASGATLSVGEAANSTTSAVTTSKLTIGALTLAGGSGASGTPSLTFNLGANSGTTGTSDTLNLSSLTFSGAGNFDLGFASATGSSLTSGVTYTLLDFTTPSANEVVGLNTSTASAANSDFAAVGAGNLNPASGTFAWTYDSSGDVTGLTFTTNDGGAATPEPPVAALILAGIVPLTILYRTRRRAR